MVLLKTKIVIKTFDADFSFKHSRFDLVLANFMIFQKTVVSDEVQLTIDRAQRLAINLIKVKLVQF